MNFFSLDRMRILHFHSGIVYFHFSVVTFFHQRQKKGLQIDLIVFFVSMASFQNFMPNHSVSTGFLLKIKPFSIQFRNLGILSKASKRKIFCSYSFFSFPYPDFFPCKRPAVEKRFLKFRNSAKKPCFFTRFLPKSRLFLVLFRNSIVILIILRKKAET